MTIALDYFHPFDGTDSIEYDWRRIIRPHLLDGVLRGEDNKFAVSGDGASGRQVSIATGKCRIRGHHGESTAIKNEAIAANATGGVRNDLVVVEADFVNNLMQTKVLTGAAGGALPSLTQDDDATPTAWQILLAQVSVANGFTNVAAGDVTDLRRWAVPAHGAGGELVSHTDAADQLAASTATGDVDWPSWAVTYRAHPNRLYGVWFFGVFEDNGSPNHTGMRAKFMEAAAQLGSAQLEVNNPQLLFALIDSPAEGAHTYKMTLHTTTGVAATSVDILGSASASTRVTTPRLWVEDLGPA